MRTLRGLIFDLDGTLIHQELDFAAIRAEIGLEHGVPILEAMDQFADTERARAEAILERHENRAAGAATALPGVARFLQRVDDLGLFRAVLTRNSRTSALLALRTAGLRGFDRVIARDDAPYKPHPGGVFAACAAWRCVPAEVVVIGDYHFDIRAGVAAGARTVLVTHGKDWPFAAEADLLIEGFDPVPSVLHHLLAG